jgi:FkbM family methyltransferase
VSDLRQSLRDWLRPIARRDRTADGGPIATPRDITNCYRLILGREPDERGYRGYRHQLRNNYLSVDQLVADFVNSTEFRNRLRHTFGSADGLPERCDFGEFVMYVRSNDQIAAAFRSGQPYEPGVLAALRSRLAPGDTFVDIGASIGYFSVTLGRHVGEEGSVIAFEPGPQNQSLLLLNLAANGVHNADVRPQALSDVEETLAYSRLGANGMIAPFDGDPVTLATHDLVHAGRLDAAIGEQRRVDAMKIDVEGAEARVLRGGEQMLARCKPFLVFEFSPPALEDVSGVPGRELLEFLAGMGYALCVLRGAGAALEPQAPDSIMDAFAAGDANHLDVAAWNRERA